jgi:ATP-dependent Clp protease, protease subunit
MKNNFEETESPFIMMAGGNQKVPTYSQVVPVNIHHFYLTGTVDEPEKYTEMVQVMKTAEEHDTIYLYINSPGGYLSSAIQIISAMRNSPAQIITVLEGEAYSAGSLIFLAGHKLVVNALTSFMIHKYSHGVVGKGSDVAMQVAFSERYYEQISKSIYKDVLTDEEMTRMQRGEDFWFTAGELVQRLRQFGREVITSEDVEEEIKALSKPKKTKTKPSA